MKGEEEYFETTSGVRQGGPESPNIFNIYLDYIMRIYNNHAKLMGIGVTFEFLRQDLSLRKLRNFYVTTASTYPQEYAFMWSISAVASASLVEHGRSPRNNIAVSRQPTFFPEAPCTNFPEKQKSSLFSIYGCLTFWEI